MSGFNDREKGFEKKFEHDQELAFKAKVRRNKLFGLWLGERMGLSEAEAASYAKEVIEADLEEPGDEDVLRKVTKDLDAKGKSLAREQLIAERQRLEIQARKEIAVGR